MEQLTNNGTTSLSAAVNNSTNPVSFTVTDASQFPASGNFRVRIDNEIFLVTSVSGTTFTATRAQESTSLANHANGASVNFTLTKESLLNVIGEMHGVGNAASVPTLRKNQAYLMTDKADYQISDGNLTIHLPPETIPFSATPTTSTFPVAIDNDANTTIANRTGHVIISSANDVASEHHRGWVANFTGNFTLTVAWEQYQIPKSSGTLVAGVIFHRSSDGHMVEFGRQQQTSQELYRLLLWNSPTSFNGTLSNSNTFTALPNRFTWLKAIYNGTTIVFSFSADGENWYPWYTYTLDSFMTGFDQVGPFVENYGSNGPAYMKLWHWDFQQ